MPARTLNSFFAGFFYGDTRADRKGVWIMGAARPVIDPVSSKQLNQIAEKRLTKWYSGEGAGIIGDQDRAI